MMKIIPVILSALALAACSGDATKDNRNGLGVAQSVYGVALTGALAYKKLPPCPSPLACRDAATLETMQKVDRGAYAAIEAAYAAVKTDPTSPATKILIQAALSSTEGFKALVDAKGK